MREYLKKTGFSDTQIYNQAISQKEKAIEKAKEDI
jgi:predicted DNA-binding transcriptional regulator AlpA